MTAPNGWQWGDPITDLPEMDMTASRDELWDDNKLRAWARNWHWNDTAKAKPVDPSIYFRDMRMLKAFVSAYTRTPPPEQGEVVAWGRIIDGRAVTVSLTRTGANDEPLYATLPRSDAGSAELSRDDLLIDPRIVGAAMSAAKQIARLERLDNVSAKEAYRTIIEAVISACLALRPAADNNGLRQALRWALVYLEGYDHVGTGSGLPAKEQRDYDEKLETIRLMVGVARETKMKLGAHFAALIKATDNSGLREALEELIACAEQVCDEDGNIRGHAIDAIRKGRAALTKATEGAAISAAERSGEA